MHPVNGSRGAVVWSQVAELPKLTFKRVLVQSGGKKNIFRYACCRHARENALLQGWFVSEKVKKKYSSNGKTCRRVTYQCLLTGQQTVPAHFSHRPYLLVHVL